MKEVKTPKKPLIFYYAVAMLAVFLFNFLAMPWLAQHQIKEVDYNTFVEMVEQDKVGKVEIQEQDNRILFTDKDESVIYKTAMVSDDDLSARLLEAGVSFKGEEIEQTSLLVDILGWVLPILIFIALGQYMSKKMADKLGGGNSMMFGLGGNSNVKVYVQSTEGIHFSDVAGEDEAKENLQEVVNYLHDPSKYQEIGASMPKGILLVGPPGTGKTMLAKRIPSILPPLEPDEALEVTKIYSVAGMLGGKGLVSERPFREPHHTVSDVALVGGGAYPRPGEVSLAHRGVLFLDELPEYGKNTLDVLRQPLEGGTVTVSRSAHSVTFPADCMLVAAMNPCPCGYATDPRHTCVCSPGLIRRYRARLSGPLLDRIDLHINVPAVPYEELQAGASPVTSARMRERVLAARAVQQARYAEVRYCRTNADLSGSLLEKHCRMGAPERAFLREAVQRLALSARAYTRILRISRTIADLAGSESIGVPHLAEAIGCRVLDREEF